MKRDTDTITITESAVAKRTRPERAIEYPESDGQPMAETDVHRDEMVDVINTLKQFFREQPEIYVSGNLFIYYEEGNPRASVAPDVFVVKGVPKGRRHIYKLWEEGRSPAMVIEITSRKTRREDQHKKRTTYAALKVREYFLYDPLAEYLRPPLQGYRLQGEGDSYLPISPNEDGSLLSQEVGVRLKIVDHRLRLIDARRGEMLLAPDEEAAARRFAEWQMHREARSRQFAEQQLLKESEARLREAEARQLAEEQMRQEAEARQLAEQQLTAMAAELARLQAELTARTQPPHPQAEEPA
ncbi:MAG: Uma2 family endonuclease [Chloroflexaceae bacterium]|nr:Uma2 family endonuclease [Chloroflexaceae bacterium]